MMQDLVHEYLAELQVVRQVSPHTLAAYGRDLKLLTERTSEAERELTQLSSEDIRSWSARMHASGLSAKSIARILSAWRGFFEWLASHKKLISKNPVDGVKAPKKKTALPKALSVEQTLTLLDGASRLSDSEDRFNQTRDLAILELLYSSGLRLSELLGIDCFPVETKTYTSVGWIDADAKEVNVLGKGKKRRTVPVGSQALLAIQRWLELRNEVKLDGEFGEKPMFINKKGQRLSARTVQKKLAELALRLGIPTHIHPHMLRHSFASHVLQSSGDLRAVQEMLGHASIASTQIYTALDFQHLARAYDQAHPRAKQKK